jgi:hypothetical protein
MTETVEQEQKDDEIDEWDIALVVWHCPASGATIPVFCRSSLCATKV